MRRTALVLVAFAGLAVAAPRAEAAYYVEYYRDNLFLGLAYHRVGCLTDWTTIQSGQEYDGFTYGMTEARGLHGDAVAGAEALVPLALKRRTRVDEREIDVEENRG